MKYVYDVMLNFQEEYFDFFEWNEEDGVIHVKRIPIFKVSNMVIDEIMYNDVRVDGDFLDMICNKTELFKRIKSNMSCILLGSEDRVMGVRFDGLGKVSGYSSMIPDEEEEVLDVVDNMDDCFIGYEVISKKEFGMFKTRKESEDSKGIMKKLDGLYEDKEVDKLRYLYLECFNRCEDDLNVIMKELKDEVCKSRDSYDKIDSFFKLIKRA